VPERRPLPRTATPLDRIVWVLVSHSAAWEQLPVAAHDLLCDQPAPYGLFFRWLNRLVHDQGALSGDEVLVQMRATAADASSQPGAAPFPGDDGDAALADLAQRIQRLHDIDTLPDPVADLIQLVRPLELDALREELDLLLQSGELSDAAEARQLELLRLTRDLKLEISQGRPISGR
jgi:DNA primase